MHREHWMYFFNLQQYTISIPLSDFPTPPPVSQSLRSRQQQNSRDIEKKMRDSAKIRKAPLPVIIEQEAKINK